MSQYHMPTKVVMGKNCIQDNSELFKVYGDTAIIVTGRSSAKTNGSEKDVVTALEKEGIDYIIYDQVMSNPTVACVYEGAQVARVTKAKFVIAIGGGSPMDAAKAIALLALDYLPEAQLFDNNRHHKALPIIAVPTTAGTGSEVTQYAMITNDVLETKSALASPILFPQIAFMDATYLMSLPKRITINTAIDALSHSVEGMLAVRANPISDALAKDSIGKVMQVLGDIQKMYDQPFDLSYEQREKLLLASMLGGMVIAQTGTTAVHAMGYSLTYFRQIDHGRANGLLLGHFMKLIEKEAPALVKSVLKAMKIETVDMYIDLMEIFLEEKETMTKAEIEKFSDRAARTPNMKNCIVVPTKEGLASVFRDAFAEQ